MNKDHKQRSLAALVVTAIVLAVMQASPAQSPSEAAPATNPAAPVTNQTATVTNQTTPALVHKNLGTALLAEHKYQKGWQEYQLALAGDPDIFQRSTNTVRVENPASVQDRGAMNYYMAKGCVRAGQTDRAIEYLRMAINAGFVTPKTVSLHEEFAAL